MNANKIELLLFKNQQTKPTIDLYSFMLTIGGHQVEIKKETKCLPMEYWKFNLGADKSVVSCWIQLYSKYVLCIIIPSFGSENYFENWRLGQRGKRMPEL